MIEKTLENFNIIAFAVAILISLIAIVTKRQRLFVGLSISGLIASLALSIFTTALSVLVVKVCTFVIIIMFASKVFKKIAKR